MAIVRNKGFVQLRRGLFEHVQNGEMSMGECFLYTAILAHADPATGVWISCASMLSSYYKIPERTCQCWLENLEKKRYLRRFRVQGKHAQYPILVHKFQCTDGAQIGMRLNAWASTSCLDLKYEPCLDYCSDVAPGEGEKKRKNGALKTSPSSFVPPSTVSIETWSAFEEMRKKIRAPLTDRARDNIAAKLERLAADGHDVEVVLNESITHGWRGVFPLKNGNGNMAMFPVAPKPKTDYQRNAEEQLEERRKRIIAQPTRIIQ
jgi:hypothetical protein